MLSTQIRRAPNGRTFYMAPLVLVAASCAFAELPPERTGNFYVSNYAGNDERAKAFTDRTGIPAFRWDVADFDACQRGVAEVEAALGPVDVLINNAGITRDGTMHKMEHDRWQQVLDTNLGGCFNMSRAVIGSRPAALRSLRTRMPGRAGRSRCSPVGKSQAACSSPSRV